ncbi:MAG: YHS domain-containing protein [Phycisphaerales bacterium]
MKSLLIALLLVIGLFFIGCKEQTPAAAPQQTIQQAVPAASAETTEQTICPVMGNPIDKNIFVEYQSKKVYFCCKGCSDEFQKDPQKYLSKLPQFKE